MITEFDRISFEGAPALVAGTGAHYEFVTLPSWRVALRSVTLDLLNLFDLSPNSTNPTENLADRLFPDEIEPLAADLFAAATELRPIKHEFRVRRPNGELRWVHAESYPTRQPDGSARWVGHAIDVTLQKEREAELGEELQLLEFCYRAARMGYWVLDVTTGNLCCSQGFADLLGCGPACGMSVDELLTNFTPDSRRQLEVAIREASQARTSWDFVGEMFTEQDGTLRVRMVGAFLKQAREPRLCCVVQDISAQAAQVEADERSSRIELLGQLAGGIAHDFNNLLTSISLSLDAIKADPTLSDRVRIAVRDAENATRSSQRLTHQLLTFAKGGEPVKVVSDIKRLVGETLDFAMSGSGCRCVREFDDELWPVNIDRAQIQQVIQNLVLNAREATSDRGEVRVTVRNQTIGAGQSVVEGNYCEIVISDNGPGIPEHIRDRLFAPYFTTKATGTGLGLATSFSIARRHSGWLSLASSPGEGAAFKLLLPAQIGKPIVETRRIAYLRRGRGRILLMDDQPDILRIVAAALSRFGYEVTPVADSEACVDAMQQALADKNPFWAAVLDLTLPGGRDGVETLRILREIDPDLPAVGCSGYAESDVMAHPQRYGFQKMLTKPFRVDELVEALQMVMPMVQNLPDDPSQR